MKKFGFIDIETLPMGNLEDFVSEKSHPKNLKDPKKIEEWYKEQEENKEEEFKKRALDTNQARILTLGFALDEQEPIIFYNSDEDEIRVLEELQEYIIENTKTDLGNSKTLYHEFSFVGHNIKNYDLQIMLVKCMQNPDRLKELGRIIYSARQRYNNGASYDTMEIWTGGSGQYNFVSLNLVAKLLGIQGKGDFDGSMVYDTWKNGDIDRIIEYQRDDVILTRAIFNKIRGIINV